ncbi:MAG: DegT/DnrJ/EryC1/StrS family aminotransferase [Candidatus Hodarchaeales archaeon]|jgi:UDP-4-amino-4,6-dideoxy-L-N-acetyl-beta-L-altrosamine transaminase
MIKCFDSNITEQDKLNLLTTLQSKVLAFGPNVSEFESRYADLSKKQYNIGFNSASSAAYLLYQYLFEKLGKCRVYTTSLGFVSPVYAAIKNGHEIVYVDVDDNLLMSSDNLKELFIDDGMPSVVMPVLYGGVSQIKGMYEFCKDNDCILVLDSAHCISPDMDYDYAFYSFHPVKPICMSNGGLLATNDKEASDYMFSGRNFGRQMVGDTYDLVQAGFNFYMNNLNASLGLSQLDKCLDNVQKRKHNFHFLREHIPEELGYFTDHDKGSSYYLSSLVLNNQYSSGIMRKVLRENGVQSSFHYPYLHKTKFYGQGIQLKKLDSLDDKIINLPIHQELLPENLEKIVNECIRYCRSGRKSQ